MNEERLFLAIGAADPELLERSNRCRTIPVVKWGLVAACMALFCAATLMTYRSSHQAPPPDSGTVGPYPVVTFTGGDVGALHLAAIYYGAAETEDFSLYVNEELYCGSWEGGSYVIRPITPTPEGLPDCDLTVSHWRGISLAEAAESVQADMAKNYSVVLDPEELPDRITLSAYNGTEFGAEWDAANARITLVDDQEGGVFTLAARFFTEATEGLGADFADMAGTFQPIPAGVVVPSWLASLRETVDALLPLAFSNDWAAAESLLTEDAQVSGYQEDVSDQVSIAAVDISPDGDEEPTDAVVSVRHRLSAEEPYDNLTIELSRINGQWKARFIGLER